MTLVTERITPRQESRDRQDTPDPTYSILHHTKDMRSHIAMDSSYDTSTWVLLTDGLIPALFLYPYLPRMEVPRSSAVREMVAWPYRKLVDMSDLPMLPFFRR